MEHSLQLTDYKFPDYFDWPFFFTIQRHAETRIKQLSMWADMIISFCRDNKLWRLSRSEFIKYMGSNTKINRKLSNDAVNIIFQFLVEKSHAIFIPLPGSKINQDEVFILWKSLNEWEEFLYASATKHHKLDSIETLEYIVNDDDNMNEEFFGMDKDLLVLILQRLERKNRCMLLADDSGRYVGVKFLK